MALPSHQAAVLYGTKDLRVDDRTLWPPQHGQAQVAIVATGLCGSDCKSSLLPLLLPVPTPSSLARSSSVLALLHSTLLSPWPER
jgi:hypothetical protein